MSSGDSMKDMPSEVTRAFWSEIDCSVDISSAYMDALMTLAERATPTARKRVTQIADVTLRKTAVRRSSSRRLEAVKVLVAMLPESEDLLRHWLQRSAGRGIHEVQFSILASLSALSSQPPTALVRRLGNLVYYYLATVRSRTGGAAWMAADLLGDCWIGQRSLGHLLEVIQNGRYAAGRRAALYGVSRYIERARGARRMTLVRRLQAVERDDPSRVVRAYARTMRVLALGSLL